MFTALVRSKKLDLKNLKHFVLDECDKMLAELDMRRDVQEYTNPGLVFPWRTKVQSFTSRGQMEAKYDIYQNHH